MPFFKSKLTPEQKARKDKYSKIISDATKKKLKVHLTEEDLEEIKLGYDEGIFSISDARKQHIKNNCDKYHQILDDFYDDEDLISTLTKQMKDVKSFMEEAFQNTNEKAKLNLQVEVLEFFDEIPNEIKRIQENYNLNLSIIESKYLKFNDILALMDLKFAEVGRAASNKSISIIELRCPIQKMNMKIALAHDKALLREIGQDMVNIKREFIEDNREITRNSHGRSRK